MRLSGRRVVITGIGVVSPIGIGVDDFWRSALAGKSGIRRITSFDPTGLPSQVAGEIHDFRLGDIARHSKNRIGRFGALAVSAARLAHDDAKLSGAYERVGVCVGSAVQGNADIGEEAIGRFQEVGWKGIVGGASLEVAAHAASANVRSELQVCGPLTTIASGCCTGIDAIAWGVEQIASGVVDAAVVGATEAPLSAFTFALFSADGFLATWEGKASEASRPYDRARCGLVLSEGAGVMVLEELEHAISRGAEVYAQIFEGVSVAESQTVRNPYERYSSALEQALRGALSAAGRRKEEIDYVAAHGNSTVFDDEAEAIAHRAAFGDHAYRLSISSIKSMIGQPFAAGGVMQVAAAALATRDNTVPPTINLDTPDPKCDLDYVRQCARVARVNYAMAHSHSLGGSVPGSHSAITVGATRLIR